MDFAHTETDKRIEELEKRLQAEYRQAYKETKGKLEKYLSDFARKDEAKRKLVDEEKLSQTDYKKWRTNQMLTGQRWTKMVDTLAKDMNRTNQIAADIISGDLKGTFALNANFAAYGIENGFQTDFGFTLYNEDTVNRLIEENPDLLPAPRVDIPEDMRWNKQKITSNITQAVLQGKSIPEIAKTMQTIVGMNKASATRNARTAMTGAQNAGRQQTYDRAKAMGIKVKKEWVATLDGRTRHSHGRADGQQVEIDGKFKVGASQLRYPGDPQGRPEEVYNCRCTMVTVEPPEILRGEEPRKTYQEWVKTKEKQKTSKKQSRRKVVEGKNISETWERRSDRFDFEIEDVINAQGFDGLPNIVSKEEFDNAVKESGFIAQRTYSAPTQEVLDVYRNELYNGKWYVDCSTGGAQYGQGMYCAADYTGTLTEGIKIEMQTYKNLGEGRYIDELADAETISLHKQKKLAEATNDWLEGKLDGKELEKFQNEISRISNVDYMQKYMGVKVTPPVSYTETLTLDPSAKIVKYEELEKMLKDYDFDRGFGDNPPAEFENIGSFAAALGYDAINAEGHGKSGSYTVILNRTKLIILGD